MGRRAIDGPGARSGPADTRRRLLDATLLVLSRAGTRKLRLSEVAEVAGVSRPTLYRYFPSKDDLLLALAEHERQRFDAGLEAAFVGAPPTEQVDAAVRFMVEFQAAYGPQHFADLEPALVLDRLNQGFPEQRASLAKVLAERPGTADGDESGGFTPEDVADLLMRVWLSYLLIPGGDRVQMLHALRAVAELPTDRSP